MPGSYGNMELYQAGPSAFINYSSASESVTFPVGTVAATLYATTKCWIYIGYPGETAVAVVPSAEKTWVNQLFPLNVNEKLDVTVSPSTDTQLVQIAVIRSTADGVLDIVTRKE